MPPEMPPEMPQYPLRCPNAPQDAPLDPKICNTTPQHPCLTKALEEQDEGAQVGTLDLGHRRLLQLMLEGPSCVEAEALPGSHPSRPACPLVCRGLRIIVTGHQQAHGVGETGNVEGQGTRLSMGTQRQRHGDPEMWGPRDVGTWRPRDIGTQGHGDIAAHGDPEEWGPGDVEGTKEHGCP